MARKYQTSEFPNIVREYFQHLFLSELSKLENAGKLLFKGGTALRIIYSSPRFSEDLDFSLFGVRTANAKKYVEEILTEVLTGMERHGIGVELKEANVTSGGYFGLIALNSGDYPPAEIEINISSRNHGKVAAEPDSIATDFTPTYTLLHLPQKNTVEEKIFGALIERKQPRDFYDTYFIMRKGMLDADQKKRLASKKKEILSAAERINFKTELEILLPVDQHRIIGDFYETLKRELERQIS